MLVVTPYYNKPNRDGLRAHFAAIAEAAGATPMVLYNIPSRSVINIAPDLLAELAAENPAIVAVKQANDDDLGPIEGLDLLAGNDDSFARALEFGGCRRDPRRLASGRAADARDLRRCFAPGIAREPPRSMPRLRPFYAAMAITSNPIPVKTALELLRGRSTRACDCRWSPASDEQRATSASALDELPGWAGKRTEVGR